MLDRYSVDQEEERLRTEIGKLTDQQRRDFYALVQGAVKDPDTYAVLNWFFMFGLHHFYLGSWRLGVADLCLNLLAIIFLFAGFYWVAALLVTPVLLFELWCLFRSQIIVQDSNNRRYRDVLVLVSK